jgi:hypothetical protein
VQAEEVNRYTFVVQVHPQGISTLENLATHERVKVGDMADVGPQIERWLSELELSLPVSIEPVPSESAPESAP